MKLHELKYFPHAQENQYEYILREEEDQRRFYFVSWESQRAVRIFLHRNTLGKHYSVEIQLLMLSNTSGFINGDF